MRNKMFIVPLFLIVAGLLSSCNGAPSLAQVTEQPTAMPGGQSNQPLRTISVNGNAQAALTPDIAYIYIGVHSENSDAVQAVSENNTQSQRVIDTLSSMGIAARDIRTTNFSIYPSQQYDREGQLQGIIYMVDNTVYVTLRDLSQIGELLNAAVQSGANNISGIQFDVADKNTALAEARQQAVANARQQAEELAQAAGVNLGDVQSITYSSSATPPPIIYGRGAAAQPAEAQVPISAGELTLSVDVYVVYLIR